MKRPSKLLRGVFVYNKLFLALACPSKAAS
jgi:hypothetical protein